MLLKCLAGIALHRFGESVFVTPLGHPQRHPRTTEPGQPDAQLRGIGRQARNQHLPGHRIAGFIYAQFGLFAVELRQKLLHQALLAGVTGIAGFLHDPPTLTADPTTANMKHLYRSFQIIVGECDHIGIRTVAEYDRLLLQYPPDCAEVITQSRRSFEVQFLRGRVHLALEIAGETIRPAREEIAEITHDLPVLLGGHPTDTGCRTFVDITEQTRTLNLTVPLEYPVRTGSSREHPRQQIECLANRPGMRVRTEVAHTFATRTAIDHQSRELLVESHR